MKIDWRKVEFYFKGILLILVIFAITSLCCTKCTAKTTNEIVNDTVEYDTWEVQFEYKCIQDLIYNPNTCKYIIEYDDGDAFDYDNLAHMIGKDTWPLDSYIEINVNNLIFTELIEALSTNDIETLESYTIKVIYTADTQKSLNFYLNR